MARRTPRERKKKPAGADEKVYSDIVDILFAIVLSQAFVLTGSDLLSWGAAKDLVTLVNTLTVYVLVIGSWVRYHSYAESGKEKTSQFFIDLLLLLLYYLGTLFVATSEWMLIIFTSVFGLYVLWELDRRKPRRHNVLRNLCPGMAFVALILMSIGYAGSNIPRVFIPTASFVVIVAYSLFMKYDPWMNEGWELY